MDQHRRHRANETRRRFPNNAHWIWKNAFKAINDAGPKYQNYTRVAEVIATYNFFLRPAEQGKSLRCTDEDAAMANAAFALHYGKLQPTAVVFLRARASALHGTAGIEREGRCLDASIVSVVEPQSKRRGNKSGCQIMSEYIATTVWP